MKKQINFLIKNNYDFKFEKEFNKIFKIFKEYNDIGKKRYVDILITNNKEIKKISNMYRDINSETDILSFPFQDDFGIFEKEQEFPLGEIVLSFEKIEKQALEFNHSLKREFCFLFAHGLIHLSGLDHKTSQDEKIFNEKVYKIMEKIKISR
ncbi:MAG: rRNA maturation RNase YbeY [Metamycoplasmataceae bacterium]